MIFTADDEPNYETLGLLDALLAALGLPPAWTDADGYEHEIEAGALDGAGTAAWIERRSKWVTKDGRPWLDVEYRVRLARDGRTIADHEVPTYNPAFGCEVAYFAWHRDRVVAVYREKHHWCLLAVERGGAMQRQTISAGWRVEGDRFLDRDRSL